MPRKARRKPRPAVVYESLTAVIERFDCELCCRVNSVARSPQHAFRYSDEDPLFPAENRLTLAGPIEWSEDVPGGTCEIAVYGDNAPSSQVQERLKDVQQLDKYGTRRWRTYHGRLIPVFDPPPGLGMLDKVRGQQAWSASIWTQPWLVSDMLGLLRMGRTVFAGIRVRRESRHWWIESFSLQTKDPRVE